ncbi:hypothetical protein HLRTI_000665 [Halorhabdus tiamatea SARL4B]|uniref:Uncharacterized protein n=1 Tax=Halorhabdus tiamatea SARL4B TaxID=1033806 RepID=F7PFX3_9EURY|nr:hypothetical protein [Halorhabdus tiamatea]ERJ07307.1 hypothetical protein HLRTI_000665 [Halorhabdus tiamatea SARL4B]CCQ34217.1 conserved hypothetical protein [Halorhabdus tiamatea SARL4B]
MLIDVAAMYVGVSTASWPLIGLAIVLFLGFFPVSRWLASKTEIQQNDERTRQLIRTAATRALFGLFAVAFILYLGGVAVTAWGSIPEPLATLTEQAEIVAVWTAAATIASSLIHKAGDQLHRRRLEG